MQDADDAMAASLMTTYTNQLANTYISYSGTGTFNTNADYARIDGPNVWIEFVAQTGVVYNTQTYFHSIWRDHARDYGGNFSDFVTVLSAKEAAAAAVFSVYPNPSATGLGLNVVLARATASATYTLRNMLGQTVAGSLFTGTTTRISTAGLAAGTYVLIVQPAGEAVVTSRVTVE